QPRHHRQAPSLLLRAGYRHRGGELRVAGPARSRPGDRHHRDPVERRADAQPLRPLGRVHGGVELVGADGLAPGGGGAMSTVNIRTLAPGTRITLEDGAIAEVVSNPNDGVWLFARYLTSPRDAALIGQEDMIFAQTVVAAEEG